MWMEKHRPQNVSDIVAHETAIEGIRRMGENKQLPHLLLHGPPGTGKTSVIMALARQLYGPTFKYSVMLLNASEQRGIDIVREKIGNFSRAGSIGSAPPQPYKLIILDEADHMTLDAQTALRRMMETVSNRVRFCFMCNYVNNIIPAIHSRCVPFYFSPISTEEMVACLSRVLDLEAVECTDDAKQLIVHIAQGDMRMCLNIAQKLALIHNNKIDVSQVHESTFYPPRDKLELLIDELPYGNLCESIKRWTQIVDTNEWNVADLLRAIFEIMHQSKEDTNAYHQAIVSLSNLQTSIAVDCSKQTIHLRALVSILYLYQVNRS